MIKLFLIVSCIFLYSNTVLSQQQLLTNAVAEYQLGNKEKAIELLRQTITTYPDFVDAKLALGQIYLETNQFEEAKKTLKSALAISKGQTEIHYTLGVAYFNLQDFDNAINEFKEVIKSDPSHQQVPELLSLSYLNQGVTLYQNNSIQSAVKKFRQAIKYDSQNIQAYKNLAILLYELERKEEAQNIIRKALKIEPSEKVLLKILIQIYADNNELDKALDPAEKYYKYYPQDVDGALQLAYLYRFNDQADKAFKIYSKALQQFPDDQRIYDDYAELYKLRNQTDDAVNIYKKAFKYIPNRSLLYEKIAEIYIYAKRYNEARTAYRNALKTTDNSSYIYQKIANTYIAENNRSKTVEVLKEGLEKSPDNWELFRELGKVLEDSSASLAIDNYSSMSKLRPDDPYSYIRLGSIYHKIDSSEQTLENCQKAIQLGTDEPLPYHILAEIQMEEQDTISAQENEVIAITKSLKIISNLRSGYLKALQNSGGKLDYSKIDEMKTDSETMDFTQNLLNQGLENLMMLSKPIYLEENLIQWRKDYPKEPLLLEYLGKNHERAGEIDQALITYKELIKLDPQVKEGHLGMARIMVKRGRLNDAILAYKRALTIDNKDQTIYENLIYLSRATETLDNLIGSLSLLEKRDPENTVLLTNYAKVLKLKNKNDELKRIEKKLKEISLHEANNDKRIFTDSN
ncbi:MAG: tetratricopeptide repeat protein [Chlorobi bacterium]|nr:tetratricopeptide repeat protein [Chlorobiota bacterium]